MLTLYRAYRRRARARPRRSRERVSATARTTAGVEHARLPLRGGERSHPAPHEPLPRARGGAPSALCATRELDARGPLSRPRRATSPSAHGIEVRIVRVGRRAQAHAALRPRAPRAQPLRGPAAAQPQLPARAPGRPAHAVARCFDRIARDPRLTTPESARARPRRARQLLRRRPCSCPTRRSSRRRRPSATTSSCSAHRFGASFEQVCHRLTTLRRPGAEGVPFHFLRIDIAGNISKRFCGSGIRIARFSGACPRWNVHAAFLTPGMIRVQLSRMPDGAAYFCIARTVRSDRGGYHVPARRAGHRPGLRGQARQRTGLRRRRRPRATRTPPCRSASPAACASASTASSAPSRRSATRLRIDENVRGVSFYAPVTK